MVSSLYGTISSNKLGNNFDASSNGLNFISLNSYYNVVLIILIKPAFEYQGLL